ELVAAMDHIARCDSCLEKFKPGLRIRAADDALRSDLKADQQGSQHLTYEESAGFVDDSLSAAERVIVENHLDLCSDCATEIADLRAFRAEMTTYPDAVRAPSGVTQRSSVWGAFALRLPLRVAAVASVVLLCGWIAFVLLRKDDVEIQVAEVHQPAGAQPPGAVEPPAQVPDIGKAPEPTDSVDEIHDGNRVIAIDKQRRVTGLESLPLSYQQTIKSGLAGNRIDGPSDLKELIARQGTLMRPGEGLAFDLIGPFGTVVRTDRPTFRWHQLS